jgi:hypothetical protein
MVPTLTIVGTIIRISIMRGTNETGLAKTRA